MPRGNMIRIRRDTAANFASVNPVLASGEPSLETDTRVQKIGDGTTAYNSLAVAGAATFAGIGTPAALVGAHVAATDPHGDRAYAAGAAAGLAIVFGGI